MEELKEWLKLIVKDIRNTVNYSMEELKEWLKRESGILTSKVNSSMEELNLAIRIGQNQPDFALH